MDLSDWLQILGILVALLGATFFATRQNKQILTQQLEIRTYEQLWLAIQELNSAIIEFQAHARMQFSSLENKIKYGIRVGESQPDRDYRNRTNINESLTKFASLANGISDKWIKFHQLWEQKEPIIIGLSTAFRTYKNEYEKISNRLSFPQLSPWNLDITNFDTLKPQLEEQNNQTIEMTMDLLVYGIDMSRMIQGKMLSKYYRHEPEVRGLQAQSGYQLTENGLVPVSSIRESDSEKP